jgi:hypothetical protein
MHFIPKFSLHGRHAMPVCRWAGDIFSEVDSNFWDIDLPLTSKEHRIGHSFISLIPVVIEVDQLVTSAAHSSEHRIIVAFKYFTRVAPMMHNITIATA